MSLNLSSSDDLSFSTRDSGSAVNGQHGYNNPVMCFDDMEFDYESVSYGPSAVKF